MLAGHNARPPPPPQSDFRRLAASIVTLYRTQTETGDQVDVVQRTMKHQAEALRGQWAQNARWRGVRRDYQPSEVLRLRPSLHVEHSLARAGAERLWALLHQAPYVATFGALTGAQAVQMVKGGLQAIYLSGWQVAADGNLAGQTYPDQSLYPSNSVPALVRRLNNALQRADQVAGLEGKPTPHWYAPTARSCWATRSARSIAWVRWRRAPKPATAGRSGMSRPRRACV